MKISESKTLRALVWIREYMNVGFTKSTNPYCTDAHTVCDLLSSTVFLFVLRCFYGLVWTAIVVGIFGAFSGGMGYFVFTDDLLFARWMGDIFSSSPVLFVFGLVYVIGVMMVGPVISTAVCVLMAIFVVVVLAGFFNDVVNTLYKDNKNKTNFSFKESFLYKVYHSWKEKYCIPIEYR